MSFDYLCTNGDNVLLCFKYQNPVRAEGAVGDLKYTNGSLELIFIISKKLILWFGYSGFGENETKK